MKLNCLPFGEKISKTEKWTHCVLELHGNIDCGIRKNCIATIKGVVNERFKGETDCNKPKIMGK